MKLLLRFFGFLILSNIGIGANGESKFEDCTYPDEEYKALAQEIGGDCIFAYIVEKWYRKMNETSSHMIVGPPTSREKLNLMKLEPPKMSADPLKIELSAFGITQIKMDEKTQEFTMSGYYVLHWNDSRFEWNSSVSKRNYSEIDQSKTWQIPLFHIGGSQTPEWNGAYKGNARFYDQNFVAEDDCFFDYKYFPYDSHKCCATFIPDTNRNRSVVVFTESDNFQLRNAVRSLSRLWNVVDVSWTSEDDIADLGGTFKGVPASKRFSACVTIKRASSTAVNEFVLPLVVSVILAIVIPFLVELKAQIVWKAFCLCVQLICLFVLVLDTDQLQLGGGTPVLLKYYDLVTWTTGFSLLTTMLIRSLSVRSGSRRIPPPSFMITICGKINSIFWCSGSQRTDLEDRIKILRDQLSTAARTSGGGGGDDDGRMNREMQEYRDSEWADVCRGMNTIMGIGFDVVYLIGAWAILV